MLGAIVAEIMKALQLLVVPPAPVDACVGFNQACFFNRGRIGPLCRAVQILASGEVFLCAAHVEKRNKHDRDGGANDHNSSTPDNRKPYVGIRAAAILPKPKSPLERLIDRQAGHAK